MQPVLFAVVDAVCASGFSTPHSNMWETDRQGKDRFELEDISGMLYVAVSQLTMISF